MQNFIFISPNFPTNYWQFCRELKNNGLNVLGIGDQPYEELKPELKASLNEYYKVNSLENYDEVYRAVAFFTFKYGRIDWLESNNEYWLERDAALRTDFHITSGFQTSDMPRIKYKSKMKEYYQKAGIATARYHMVDDLESCRKFIDEVGYPVVVKPDNGVGASDTHKLSSDEELKRFLLYKSTYHPDLSYIMEEFVHAEVNSYDAIIDGSGNPIFEAGNVSPMSIMDIVNDNDNSIYYIIKDLPEDTRAAGRAAVKSFGVKSRFVHFEFFRMTENQASMGKKGQIVALEVNMRPCGGFTPDMIDFARSTNVYKIWADMIAFGGTDMPVGEHFYCPFAGRRDGKHFVYSHEQLMQKYQDNMRMVDRIPEALSGAMGNQMYVATFSTRDEMEKFYSDVLAVTDVTNAKVQLHWVRSEVPDFAMPFYLSGGLLAVLAVLCASVFAMPPHKRRKRMVEGKASAVIEEEAPASIAVSGKPDGASRRNRRRHATHRRSGRASSQSSQSEATETPVIIDPSSRNLVADQQTGAESGAEPGLSAGDNESTSVITPDELQAYFSRLAQEVNTGDDSADDGQEES